MYKRTVSASVGRDGPAFEKVEGPGGGSDQKNMGVRSYLLNYNYMYVLACMHL